MNLKAGFLTVATVAATLTTASLAVSPAQATTLNGTLNLSNTESIIPFFRGGVNLSPTALNFYSQSNGSGQQVGIGNSTGSFASFTGI